MFLSALWVWSIVQHGIPTLRHDWAWPQSHESALWSLLVTTSAWNPAGVGHPNVYLGAFLPSAVVGIINVTLGSYPGLVIFLSGISLALSTSIAYLASKVNAKGPWRAFPLEAIALFNPWTYNEVVAGHTLLVLGAAGIALLLAELIDSKRRNVVIILGLLCVAPQLQLYAIACVIVALISIQERRILPIVCAIVVGLPELFGLLCAGGALANIPYTLSWQDNQSATLAQLYLLTGYATAYANHLSKWTTYATFTLVCCAFLGLLLALRARNRPALYLACVAGVTLLIASGTKGPISAIYIYAVTTLHFTGVFRELYDLIGITLVGYIGLSAVAVSNDKFHALQTVLLAAAAISVISWLQHPPSTQFASATVHSIDHLAGFGPSRFALYPALQPLQRSDHVGSGVDPDAFGRSALDVPLNLYSPTYAELAALCRTDQDLEALSVGTVVVRTDLLGSNPSACGSRRRHSERLTPRPEVLSQSTAPIVSLADELGDGSILDKDAGNATNYMRPMPTASSPNDLDGWILAQLVFQNHPGAIQPYGGIATANRTAPYIVPTGAHAALVRAPKTIFIAGRRSVHSTFAWVGVRPGDKVLCGGGQCVIAELAKLRPSCPLNEHARHFANVTFTMPLVGWVNVEPPFRYRTINYNTQYLPGWVAWQGYHVLKHIRLDGFSNGWILRNSAQRVRIIYLPILFGYCLEFVVLIVILLLLLREVKRGSLARPPSVRPETASDSQGHH